MPADYVHRLDKLEMTVTTGLEAIHRTLHRILSRLDSESHLEQHTRHQDQQRTHGESSGSAVDVVASGTSTARPPAQQFTKSRRIDEHLELNAELPPSGDSEQVPTTKYELRPTRTGSIEPGLAATKNPHSSTSKKRKLPQFLSSGELGTRRTIRIPGGNSNVFRATSEARQLLSHGEREDPSTEARDVVESHHETEVPLHSTGRRADKQRTGPSAGRSIAFGPLSVHQALKRNTDDGAPLPRPKRARFLPYVLLDRPALARRARSEVPRQDLVIRDHVASNPRVPEPANDDDSDVIQTDLQSLAEDTDDEEDLNDILGLSDVSALTDSTIDTDSEDEDDDEEMEDVPIVVRNGSVDYGSLPPAQNLPASEHEAGQVEPSDQNQKPADREPSAPGGDMRGRSPARPAIPTAHHQESRGPPPVAGPSRIRRNKRPQNRAEGGPSDPGPDQAINAATAPAHRRKVKSERSLPPDGVRERLANIPSFEVTLDPDIRSVAVTRQFMAAKYHCNLIQVYTKDFAFPNPSMNPEIPTVPGQPGLMCDAVTVDVDWTQTRKILVRHAVNQWQYLGNYQAARVRSLAVEEFSSLAQIVKDTWVEYIIDAKWDSYKALHAKIGLHERYGREASEDELNDALAANEQFLLSPEVVLAAFESGQHEIYIYKLWCVSYDEAFQRRLAQDFPGWVPPPKLSAEGRKAKAEAKAKAKAKAKSKAKAKAKTKPPAPAPAVVKNEVNEDDEYAPLHPPAHRGTRNVAPNDPSEATVGVRRSCRTVKTLRRYIEIGEDGEEYRDEPMEVE